MSDPSGLEADLFTETCETHPHRCDPDITVCDGCATGLGRCVCGQRDICLFHSYASIVEAEEAGAFSEGKA